MKYDIDPRILNLQPSDPSLVARLVSVSPPPVVASSEIEDFDDWPSEVKIKTQGRYGACNGHAAATGLESSRVRQGFPYTPLSAWWVYGCLVEGRDRGSNIMEALALCSEHGVAPESAVKWGDFSGRYPQSAIDQAKRYRIQVGHAVPQLWDAILTAVWMRRVLNLSVRASNGWLVNRGSLDANGCPPVGRGPCNHAVVVGGGVKTLPNGERAVKMVNSWDLEWGWQGTCWLRRAHIESTSWFEAYTIEAASSDPQDRLPNVAAARPIRPSETYRA